MDETRLAKIDHKLWTLERRLASIEYQLAAKQGTRPVPKTQEEPPGFTLPPIPQPPRSVPLPEPPPARSAAPPPNPTASPSSTLDRKEAEYMIGAKVLPRVGAGMVVLAMVFFVVWGFSSGWITPLMVFLGEILFCLAFVVLGLVKRNEREEYGQILTGIGSCGLYLTFAGGNVVYDLYGGEFLVAAFVSLSLANLVFSLWRSSRSFLVIGLAGGLIGALLPTEQGNYGLNAALHFLIVAPSAYIAWRNRWAGMAMTLWVLSTLSLVPLLVAGNVSWKLGVAALYGSSLLSFAALSRCEPSRDARHFAWIAPCFVALVGLGVYHEPPGAVHLALLGAGLYAISLVAKSGVGSIFAQLGIALPLLLGPACFPATQAAALYAAIAITCSLNRAMARLGALVLAFGLGAYLIAVTSTPVERLTDIGLILGLMAAATTLTRSLVKAEGRAEGYVMTCVALMFPLIARLANVTFAGQPALMSPHMAAALATTAFSAFTVGLAARTKWLSAQAFQWGSLTIACSVYVWAAFEGMPFMAEASVAAALGVVCVAALRVGSRLNPALLEELVAWGIALCGALMVRVCVIVLMTPDIGLDSGIAITIGLMAAGVGTSLLAVLSRWRIASILQWAWLLPAVAVYFGVASSNPMSQPWNIGLASALLTLAVASCVISWHRGGEADRSTLIGFSSAIVGLLFIRVFGLAMQPWPWLVSLAWSSALYASIAALACRKYRLEVLSATSWTALLASGLFYMGAIEQLAPSPWVDFSMILAALVTLAIVAFTTEPAEPRGYWKMMVVLGWIIFTRLGVVSFLWSGMDVPADQARSISWTVYALVLLAVGFARENQQLRYGGLFVLAATSAKVLLVDLAFAPPSIRVLVTLGLGLAMLGGGYWYIRGRRPAQ